MKRLMDSNEFINRFIGLMIKVLLYQLIYVKRLFLNV